MLLIYNNEMHLDIKSIIKYITNENHDNALWIKLNQLNHQEMK